VKGLGSSVDAAFFKLTLCVWAACLAVAVVFCLMRQLETSHPWLEAGIELFVGGVAVLAAPIEIAAYMACARSE
jgi:hypothetical protein